jgi:hypothetical protein
MLTALVQVVVFSLVEIAVKMLLTFTLNIRREYNANCKTI